MSYFGESGYMGCFLDDVLESKYPMIRFSGTTLVDGRREKNIDTDVDEIIAHIEDASPRKLERLTDHENKLSKISIISKFELRTTDELNSVPADIVAFRNRLYEVKEVSQENSATNHFKALAILVNQ